MGNYLRPTVSLADFSFFRLARLIKAIPKICSNMKYYSASTHQSRVLKRAMGQYKISEGKDMRLRFFAMAASSIALLCVPAFASLIPIGAVSLGGQGLGAVDTSVTFQNTGTESGCVGTNTAGTAVPGGSFVGSAECPAGIAGGDEKVGNGQSNVYTASQLGISSSGSDTFANLVLLFNGDQTGASPNITLNNLALDFFVNGALTMSFTAPSLPTTYTAFPGVGNAGFGYRLDATQAAVANTYLATHPSLEIGTAATATGANGGPETISLSTISSTQVPEPSTYVTLAVGLGVLGILRKRVLKH